MSRAPIRLVAAKPQALVAVASGKGGVGKTWLSITLAQAFAFSGERALLVDGDLGLANVDVQLGIDPTTDIASVVAGRIQLADAAQGVQGGAGALGGFDVIAGRSGSGALADLPSEIAGRIAVGALALSAHYDRIVLDLGAGVHANILRMAAMSPRQIIVVTDEPTSLTDAYAFIKLLRQLKRESEPWIVVNLADSKNDGAKTYQALAQACESFLKFKPELLGVIPRDPRVRDAIRAQMPLMSRSPQSTAAEAVSRIAQEIQRETVAPQASR
jgi:flagellar biosynthesis protein FlhG